MIADLINKPWQSIAAAIVAALSLLVNPAAITDEKVACEFDREAMLAMEFDAFDQTFGQGWRAVAAQDGCSLAAADLIREYIDTHQSKERIVVFHEAQMRAKGGQTLRAIELFRQTREADGESNYFGWNHYVDATIAFLKQDKASLLAARESLAELPKPSGFKPVDRNGNPVEITWPPNLNVVDGFIACFDESYAIAYSDCSRSAFEQSQDE